MKRMKKNIRITSILMVFLFFTTAITLSACSENLNEEASGETASETTESSIEITETETTIDLGELYDEPEYTDYSDFGFFNNYGMTEWGKISGYSIDGTKDSFVYSYDAEMHDYFSFSDTFFRTYDDYLTKTVDHTASCRIEDNDTITFTTGDYSGTAVMITERKVPHNIPIIVIECNENYWGHRITDEGWYIPTDFIDLSRSPEKGTITYDDGETEIVEKYYIKEEYLENEVY